LEASESTRPGIGKGVWLMLGIEDKGVLTAYLLCIASTILCIVYGLLNWNKGNEDVQPDDVKWAAEEKKVEEEV
jgi:hypothetical protein